jgi:hypothetical protein
MEWAALVAWIFTAAGGSLLFVQWWRHGGPSQQEGIRSIRLAAHAGTAVVGLILWIAFVASDTRALAWLAVALLVLVALVGFSMLLISSRGRTRHVRTETPAEGMFPLPLVAGHGILAVTTLTLTLLAAAGIGTS